MTGAGARRATSRARRRRATRGPAQGRTQRDPTRLPMPSALLDATTAPDIVEIPARIVVAIDGAGPPESPAFGRSLGAIYGAAYGLKFARKGRRSTFKIGPLEGRWWADGAPEGNLAAPRETWRWRLRIAVPDDVSEAELADVIHAATTRKGGKLEGSEEAGRVRLERVPAARFGRILHRGPYADEPLSFERLDATVEATGLRPARPHVEIYLSDPRRTAPDRLKTVLLREIME